MNKFGPASTAAQVLAGCDLHGKRILVTGASSGVGLETARALAAQGAQVIGTARDPATASAAVEKIRSLASAPGHGSVELTKLDLASLTSVRACADALLANGRPLDAIIANAGLMAGPQGLTVDGFERQFGTNHLGHFVLINRLAPLLLPGGRVACVSSAGHRRTDVDLDDPGFQATPYDEFIAYGRSKTAVILFAVEFDRRHLDRGIRAAALHPGAIQTATVQRMIAEMIAAGRDPRTASYDWKTVEQGAATSAWVAITASANEVGGRYCEDCHVAGIDDDPTHRQGVRSYAVDPDRARALWARSEDMVGERF